MNPLLVTHPENRETLCRALEAGGVGNVQVVLDDDPPTFRAPFALLPGIDPAIWEGKVPRLNVVRVDGTGEYAAYWGFTCREVMYDADPWGAAAKLISRTREGGGDGEEAGREEDQAV